MNHLTASRRGTTRHPRLDPPAGGGIYVLDTGFPPEFTLGYDQGRE